jgi:hypothetical protein
MINPIQFVWNFSNLREQIMGYIYLNSSERANSTILSFFFFFFFIIIIFFFEHNLALSWVVQIL